MKNSIEVRVEAIIFNKEGKLLLIEHKKNQESYWVLPGGHLEYLERFENGIKRELKEELSIDKVNVVDICFVNEYINDENKRHVVKIGFLCNVDEKEIKKIKISENEVRIKNFGFFSSSDIAISKSKFYPDKDFFIRLIGNKRGKYG